MSRRSLPASALSALLLALQAGVAGAQQPATPPPADAAPPAADGAAPAAPQRVEITGGRGSDSEQRRQSTAAKIVIGREEIERFGDSNALELLKRLPGVTVPGVPGRGGPPRMRGMAGGFTQILLDGERIPPGFTLDSIPPDQIERIEILRAPTAETGARAIAGTINIVLREGFRRRVNDLNLDVQRERDLTGAGLSWSRNDALAGAWVLNSSLSLSRRHFVSESRSERLDVEPATGDVLLQRDGTSLTRTERDGLHAHARLSWRDDAGRSLQLMPMLIVGRPTSTTQGTLTNAPDDYARFDAAARNRFVLQRLNLNFNHRLGSDGPRLEWRAGWGDARFDGRLRRSDFDAADAPVREIDERSDNRERSASLALKASLLAGAGHQLVAGGEIEDKQRRDGKTTTFDGVPQLTEFGDNLQARSRRQALYAQDEWSITPRWAVHAGLRTEAIDTEGEGAEGNVAARTSRVTTPLLHTVWKFDANARDQLRASLTRSWRAPELSQLIGRPSVSRLDPAPGPNTELTADGAGNPRLKAEVALGIDLAVERYLPDGGVLSANLFHRRIRDLIRNVVALEEVSWSPGQPRYVSRPQNIGSATTQGLELEAKLRLDQLLADAPRTELRANASVFRSRVDAVPGPDNRLAEQPGGTLNLGFDHRLRGTPLSFGASWNHTPGYRTQLEADRAIVQSEKNVVDAYALWSFTPDARLRLSLSKALAPDTGSTTTVVSDSAIENSRITHRSYVNAQLRLELKL